MNKNKKIAVLVSGGVDSSVALALLKKDGYDVAAFYLKIWLEDELSYLGDCPWEEDLSYVRKVCDKLEVPLEVVSLQKEYHDEVVNYVLKEVQLGRTPNPDILCNKHIKFGLFLNKIDDSFDKIASGHYAQVQRFNGKVQLVRAPDPIKDQTYFLSHLNQEQLQRVMFPIGHLHKDEVRALAHEFDLPNKDRKDSQGICFLGKFKYRDFIKHYLGEKPGPMVEFETDEVVGLHNGFWFYTIGQRQGLGLAGGPWYVVEKESDTNTVYISRNYHTEDKKRNTLTITSPNWIAGQKPDKNILYAKMRHGPQFYRCYINFSDANTVEINLDERDQGIAPGQFAVLYDDQVCLGGGVIQSQG